MKIQELLIEKPMNYRTYNEVLGRVGSSALVGFEFEMLVPSESEFMHDIDTGPTIDLNSAEIFHDVNEYHDFAEFFMMYGAEKRMVTTDYENWFSVQYDYFVEKYVYEHWHLYLDKNNDIGEEEAMRLATKVGENSFDSSKHSFNRWLLDEFGTGINFVRHYDLTPRHGWVNSHEIYGTSDDDESRDKLISLLTYENVKKSLIPLIGDNISVSLEYHSIKTSDAWRIEPDGSIEGDGIDLELISPPLPIHEALKTVKKIFNWMKRHNMETNSSTGLHINVSFPDMTKLDPLKLILFLGEKFAAGAFRRLNNEYAIQQGPRIIKMITLGGIIPSSEEMMKLSRDYLFSNKYQTINFKHLDDEGYIEARFAGGNDYEKDVNKVITAILRVVTAVDTACDPKKDKQEYAKKVSKLLNIASETIQSANQIREMPEELRRLSSIDTRLYAIYDNLLNGHSFSANDSPYAFAERCIKAAYNVKTTLQPKERAFLKKFLLKTHQVKPEYIDTYCKNDPVLRARFKRELGI